ncbi:MAG: phosphatidylglycerol lysyltransferase domain-containing protein [Thermosynechococcaceae cyanobacterium]
METQKQPQMGLWITGFLIASMGVINLFSAVTPSLPERVNWLRDISSLEMRHSGHLFAALSGFFLLTLATGLLRRKRLAWVLTLLLLVVSIFSHLIKGLDYEESLFAGALLILLMAMRKTFTAQSDRPAMAQGVRVLIGSLLFTLTYGTAGFFLLDRAYNVRFDLPGAVAQTLAMFFTDDNAGLVPIRRFGQFFADSIYLVGGVTLTYALLMLLRPVLLHGEPATAAQRQCAQAIVEHYGCSSLARFTLLNDKAYYFSPSGQSMIAYVPKGRGAIALGDPIGPPEDREEAILGFQKFCDRNDWHPAFYQTLPDNLALYASLGFRVLKIGEEAIIDLKTFTLKGKTGQNFRTTLNKFKKLGYQVEFYHPPLPAELLPELRDISDEWLRMVQGSEKKFSLGWFDETYLNECDIAVVRTAQGHLSVFANVVSEYQINEITIDLMRHRKNMENGTMDFLFVSMFQYFQEKGYDGFNLGLSALSGVGGSEQAPRLEKGMHYLYEHLNQFYNFKGLHAYKEKFHPRWEPRYLVYPSLSSLPDVVVGLVRADSGDRLLDYFKPGS